MEKLHSTVFKERHESLGARIVEFGGWEMPLQYDTGIVQEHLETRKHAGLFDISHMGRFVIRGQEALEFLQHVLTNNAAALEINESQYTIISNESGGAIDDAFLYRFEEDEYLLIVNAANRVKDWTYLQAQLKTFEQTEMVDRTHEIAMLSLQGPASKEILLGLIDSGNLPEPIRNALSSATINGRKVFIARTGYTGEPICFELFISSKDALMVWDLLIDRDARPIGLGARDTLRLEAGLPLYGHELGEDADGREIPIFASSSSRIAVSFSTLKGNFIGRQALYRQFEAYNKIINNDFSLINDLPRIIMPVALIGKGLARAGFKVFCKDEQVGYVTSGTMIPYWQTVGSGISSRFTDEKGLRAICLALINSDLREGDELQIEIRGKMTKAVIVPYHMRSEAPPFTRAIIWDKITQAKPDFEYREANRKVLHLINRSVKNTIWRQQECINLIPSEQTVSSMTRMLSIMDPAGRYAEHKQVKAFSNAEVFYYQGTDFIAEVEELLKNELCRFLGCNNVETRVVSGQMANAAVYSSMVDYLNRADRKSEQRRIRCVLNNHIIKGGHLSAQPMGALRDFVARDPKTEKPAVVNFPVLEENPYKIDLAACRDIIAEYQPELIIFGKSMTLHTEPVVEIRSFINELSIDCVILYDVAHVLGLVGPYFQQPFLEGADIVTGSTHKTYFGTQRGIIGSNLAETDHRYELWETIQRRTFPGSLSNHHLGTMLGLLLAAYEMNFFKDDYQKNVLANARAFAKALKECGLDVAGDPGISYTQTHQVILNVGYARGPAIARRLEENNIIVNYQAAPEEEGFTASGSLRMGVQEMTRFGMGEKDFQELAQLIHDVIKKQSYVKEDAVRFRKRFLEMKYCFSADDFKDQIQKLHQLI